MGQLKGAFGVEIRDLVLRRAGMEDLAALRAALERSGLAVLRRQSLSDDELLRAASGLSAATTPIRRRTSGAVAHVSNLTEEKGRPLGKEDYASPEWADDSRVAAESRFRLLYAIEVPASGGDLYFCDLESALAALPPEKREAAEAARIEDGYLGSLRRLLGVGRRDWPAELVHLAPHGGLRLRLPRKGERISGMDPGVACAFVASLLNDLTAESYCLAHEWGPGDVLIWDRGRFLRRRDQSTGVYLMKTLCFT